VVTRSSVGRPSSRGRRPVHRPVRRPRGRGRPAATLRTAGAGRPL